MARGVDCAAAAAALPAARPVVLQPQCQILFQDGLLQWLDPLPGCARHPCVCCARTQRREHEVRARGFWVMREPKSQKGTVDGEDVGCVGNVERAQGQGRGEDCEDALKDGGMRGTEACRRTAVVPAGTPCHDPQDLAPDAAPRQIPVWDPSGGAWGSPLPSFTALCRGLQSPELTRPAW